MCSTFEADTRRLMRPGGSKSCAGFQSALRRSLPRQQRAYDQAWVSQLSWQYDPFSFVSSGRPAQASVRIYRR